MRLIEATRIAEEIRAALAPYCERCEIAGSIRRKKAEVGDIEIVAMLRTRDLPAIVRVVDRWPAVRGKVTGRYTQRRHPSGMLLDLFLTIRDNWGLIYAIRTGSAHFSHTVLACGWVRAGYQSQGGMLHRSGAENVAIPVREERDLFAMIGVPWVEPEART